MADTKTTNRHDRLSAALRENLKRRKAQLRARAQQAVPSAGEPAADCSEEPADDPAKRPGEV